MPRNLTSNLQALAATKLGTEPILILAVEWDTGVVYYSDKAFVFNSEDCEVRILNSDSISSQVTIDKAGEVSSINVELSDTDETLKNKVNSELLEGTLCTLYQTYQGETDSTIVLKGKMAGDIIWSEAERKLSFMIETTIEKKEVGYAPEEDDLENLSADAIGVPWPLCFGTVLRVPAVHVRKAPHGRLQYTVSTYSTYFHVDNGESFPQDEEISIDVWNEFSNGVIVLNGTWWGPIRFRGTFSGNKFTIAETNANFYTYLPVDSRPLSDDDYDEASVLWLDDEYPKAVDKFWYVDHDVYGPMVNRCIARDGTKYIFEKSWRPSGTDDEVLLDSDDTILGIAGVPRTDWNAMHSIEVINSAFTPNIYTRYQLTNGTFNLNSGGHVTLAADYTDLFVCNLVPSTQILAVLAKRNDKLVPIPSSYYTKHLSLYLAGNDVTAIEFEMPIDQRKGEEWDSDIYVSLISTIGNNTADIIQWIIETYTTLETDTSTFSTAHDSVENFPSNFALFEIKDAIELCEQIAWQARCGIFNRADTIYIKYLSEVPDTDLEITSTIIHEKSVEFSFKSTEDIYTRLTALWHHDYFEEDKRKYVTKNNIDTFGLKDIEKDFFIYNIESLVKVSADFWLNRFSKSWRQISCTMFYPALTLEVLDTVNLTLSILSENSIKGVVQNIQQEDLFTVSSEMASEAGETDSDGYPVQDDTYWDIGSHAKPDDPTEEEIDYTVPVPDEPPGQYGTDNLTYKVTVCPTDVDRGVAFNFEVQIVDKDENVALVTQYTNLTLKSTDTNDILATEQILITNGIWAGQLTISGGAGTDTAYIEVTKA